MADHIYEDRFVSIDLTRCQNKALPGSQFDDRPYPTSMWEAAVHGNINALDYYIQHAIHNINSEDDDEEEEEEEEEELEKDTRYVLNSRDPETCCTLLHLVISHNKNPIQAIEYLLEKGADPTMPNIYGIQAIHSVILNCPTPLDCIKLLLKNDVNVNACDSDGWTPLHYAARFCKDPEPVFRFLINKGADVNAVNSTNKTPVFSLLASDDYGHILKWLLDERMVNLQIKGSFLNTKTHQTRTGSLLLQAAKYGRLKSLQVLVNYITQSHLINMVTDRQELLFAIDIAKQEAQTNLTRAKSFEKMTSVLQYCLQKFDINKALSPVDEEKQMIVTPPYTQLSFFQRLLLWGYAK